MTEKETPYGTFWGCPSKPYAGWLHRAGHLGYVPSPRTINVIIWEDGTGRVEVFHTLPPPSLKERATERIRWSSKTMPVAKLMELVQNIRLE